MKNDIDICHCNLCQKETKVDVLYEYVVPREESYEYGVINDVYRLVRCKTCKLVFIKNIIDDVLGDIVERHENTIPPKQIVYDHFPEYFKYPDLLQKDNDPYPIFKMYREVLTAINSNCFWLAFCGMRSVIEQACQDKFNCKIGKFKDFKDEIKHTTLISDTLKQIIQYILDATHSSVHRKFFPEKEQVLRCLDWLEKFLEQIYILPQKAIEIKNTKLPNRKGKFPED